jgi:hypothetical protein
MEKFNLATIHRVFLQVVTFRGMKGETGEKWHLILALELERTGEKRQVMLALESKSGQKVNPSIESIML